MGREIERFAWIDRWLARGGQPDSAAFEMLRMQGIRIIVNLRQRDGRKMVERAGLSYVHIPVKNDHAPTRGQIRQWLELCSAHHRADPIFVHCKGGEGRTSAFCAAVRLAQGHDVESAIAEQRSFDFDPEGKHAEQAQFLRDLAGDVAAGRFTIPLI
jgi:protein tyrosine phosphatase (PTP) superfamily phosphohydrolase (DUF442 family)